MCYKVTFLLGNWFLLPINSPSVVFFLWFSYGFEDSYILAKYLTQPAFTCSKLTIETVEQDVKDVFLTFANFELLMLIFSFWGNTLPLHAIFPACNQMFKVSYRNSRTRCEICSKLTIKTHKLTSNM